MNDVDLDAILTRLAQAPAAADLSLVEDRVMARIAARPAARAGIGISAMTIAVALVMGIVSAGVPAKDASAAPLSFFEPNSPLAPSTLLVGTP